MSPTILPAIRRRQGLHGRHVAAAFLTFFAVVFLMNGAMIYAAISTYSGLVANEPYRKGLHYNERIDADERQARLGWRDSVTITRTGAIVVTLEAPGQGPVIGVHANAILGRPSTNRHDIKLPLIETSPGRYEAQAGPLADGTWTIELEARRGASQADPEFRMRRRLWLKP